MRMLHLLLGSTCGLLLVACDAADPSLISPWLGGGRPHHTETAAVSPSVASDDEPVGEPEPPAPNPRPTDPYQALRYDAELTRNLLSVAYAAGQPVAASANTVFDGFVSDLIQSWVGTRYDFFGTTQVPGRGTIACGYFVSTVLEHAGLRVDRVDLARQPSEQIIRTLVPDRAVQRFSRAKRKDVVASVVAQGPGIFIVGLDTHVGFLVSDGRRVEMCHSTQRQRKGVVCEDAETSPSMRSRYTVIGKLQSEELMHHWLSARELVTAHRGRAQRFDVGGPPRVASSSVIEP